MSEPPAEPLPPAEGAVLARLAVGAVAARLRGQPLDDRPPEPERLRAPGASFVTLENRGALRGCIGTLEPVRPLYLDVTHNAVRAMTDPRLPPVTRREWPHLDVKVSVLGPPTPLPVTTVAELLAALRPGIDGLTLIAGGRRATFLPSVWHKLPEPAKFVSALLVKGGWPASSWPAGVVVARYTSTDFIDVAPRPSLGDLPLRGGGHA
jgi:AmmeMemoRadiSam system protein A